MGAAARPGTRPAATLQFGIEATCTRLGPAWGSADGGRPAAVQSWLLARVATSGKPHRLPMLTARRLQPGDRHAAECALELLARHPVDAMVFSSRHGDLPNIHRILGELWHQRSVSPTRFAMSVHNAVSGVVTIAAQAPLPTSSIAAGPATFVQSFYEVAAFFAAGYRRVLLTHFEDRVPDFYAHLGLPAIADAYATALLLTAAGPLRMRRCRDDAGPVAATTLPAPLAFVYRCQHVGTRFRFGGNQGGWQVEGR